MHPYRSLRGVKLGVISFVHLLLVDRGERGGKSGGGGVEEFCPNGQRLEHPLQSPGSMPIMQHSTV